MGQGRLDPYRAGVVAEELAAAPPQVRETVVTMLEGHFEVEDGAHLRRRCRRALARISPELLLERAKRARAECGLRRWVAEPGVDRWEGTFPSEDAARAWAAIDALAHRYVKDGVCTHIEAARGKALTDLVAGQATIEAVLTLTVPAAGVTRGAVGPRAAADACAASRSGRTVGRMTWSRSSAPPATSRCSSPRNWRESAGRCPCRQRGRPPRAGTVEVAPPPRHRRPGRPGQPVPSRSSCPETTGRTAMSRPGLDARARSSGARQRRRGAGPRPRTPPRRNRAQARHGRSRWRRAARTPVR